MNKLLKSIVCVATGLAMAIGVGVGASREAKMLDASSDSGYTAATMTPGTNGSECEVNGNSGVKVGTSKAGGDMSITVPSGATDLRIYAAAWKGVTGLSLNITKDSGAPNATISTLSISLTADDGVSNNSPFTLAGTESDFKFDFTLTNITSDTVFNFTSSSSKRFVVWSAQTKASGNVVTISSLTTDPEDGETVNLNTNGTASIASSVLYEIGYSDSSTGYNISKTISPSSNVDVADDGAGELTLTFTANGTYVLTISADNDHESEITFVITGVPVAEYSLYNDAIKAGDYVIMSADANYTYVVDNAISSNRLANGDPVPSVSNGTIANPSNDYVWHIAKSGDYWTIQNAANNKYLAGTGSKNQATLLDDITDNNLALWSITYSNGWVFHNLGRSQAASDTGNAYLRNNTTYGWACYGSATGNAPALFKYVSNSPEINVQVTGLTTLFVDDTATLTVSKLNGASGTVEWATSNSSILDINAQIGDSITVTAEGAGTATITASLENCEDCEIAFVVIHDGTSSDPYTIFDAKAAIDAGIGLSNVYVAGIVSQVDSFNETYSSITYWISDDGTTANQFEVYSGKDIGGADFSSINDIEVGATVVVKGNIQKYNTKYEFAQNNELVTYTVPVKTLSSIALSGTYPTTFTVGDAFSHEGMTVTATYDDNSTKDVTASATFSGYDMSTVDSYTVTVSYTEGEETAEATYQITVNSAPVSATIENTGIFAHVTSVDDIDDGAQYLISFNDEGTNNHVFDGALNSLDVVGNGKDVLSDNLSEIKAACFTITVDDDDEDVFYIKSSSGYYIGQTKNDNGLATSDSEAYPNSIEFDENGNATIVSSSAHLRYNSASNQARFRYYKSASYSGQKDIRLYKLLTSTASRITAIRGTVQENNGNVAAVTNLTLRFGVKIPKADWDRMQGVTEYGIKMFLTSTLTNVPTVESRGSSVASVSKLVSEKVPDEDGLGNYNFLVVVEIPDALPTQQGFGYNSYFCVRPYIKIGTQIHWLLDEDMHESIVTLAQAGNNTNLSSEALELLANK